MKISVMGVAGRMGRELVRAAIATEGCVVTGGVEPDGSPHIGEDIGVLSGCSAIGVAVSSDALASIVEADAILDFTTPSASVEFAGLAANARIIHVLGTTGFSETDDAAIEAAARHATIIKAGNMSLGVNLVAELTRKIAAVLDEEYDIEIVEMHHRHKVDAPSGTALMLGEAAAEGRKISLKERSVRSRDGHPGARTPGDIGFATLRGGDVVGEHTVVFAADGERIEIAHKAADRGIFSRGAVKAALWGKGKGPGLFAMTDVLGI